MASEDLGYPDLLPGELEAVEAEDRRRERAIGVAAAR